MLVLTRRNGEAICIGDQISVRVVEIHASHVRLAIDAPRSVAVHREEIYEVVKQENLKASRLAPDADPAALWRRKSGKDREES